MSAFVVATPKITNPEKFAEYSKAAGATVGAHGGAVAKRGKYVETLAGNVDHQSVAVIEFSDIDALNTWFNSPEYQAIIPLRDEACDMTLVSYIAPPA
ncbi:DUF1330 domain-containing protein [Maritalea sp.]|uniref:DUF1330 domain-containing protein n=1 Tax=Maritalea sp. TaxID=2003361 RepID=UPI003EFA5AFF